MIEDTTEIRIRYGETDRMGYVYYGNYPLFYEVGRTELMRKLGFPYKKLEDMGIMLPVKSLEVDYISPSYYDDLIQIKTTLSLLKGVKVEFRYELFDQKGRLLNKGKTTLVFVDYKTRKPIRVPEDLLEAVENYTA